MISPFTFPISLPAEDEFKSSEPSEYIPASLTDSGCCSMDTAEKVHDEEYSELSDFDEDFDFDKDLAELSNEDLDEQSLEEIQKGFDELFEKVRDDLDDLENDIEWAKAISYSMQ